MHLFFSFSLSSFCYFPSPNFDFSFAFRVFSVLFFLFLSFYFVSFFMFLFVFFLFLFPCLSASLFFFHLFFPCFLFPSFFFQSIFLASFFSFYLSVFLLSFFPTLFSTFSFLPVVILFSLIHPSILFRHFSFERAFSFIASIYSNLMYKLAPLLFRIFPCRTGLSEDQICTSWYSIV